MARKASTVGYRVVGLRRTDQRVPIECEDCFFDNWAGARIWALGCSARYGWGYVIELARPCRLWLFKEGVEVRSPQLEFELKPMVRAGFLQEATEGTEREPALSFLQKVAKATSVAANVERRAA